MASQSTLPLGVNLMMFQVPARHRGSSNFLAPFVTDGAARHRTSTGALRSPSHLAPGATRHRIFFFSSKDEALWRLGFVFWTCSFSSCDQDDCEEGARGVRGLRHEGARATRSFEGGQARGESCIGKRCVSARRAARGVAGGARYGRRAAEGSAARGRRREQLV